MPLALNNGYNNCIDPMPYLNLTAKPTAPRKVSFSHTWNVDIQKVKDFQTKHGLVADGIVGPKTQNAIDLLI